MSSPVEDEDPLAAIRRQQEALAAASWSPVDGVDGLESAAVTGMTAVRRVGTTGPVLWYTAQEWQRFVDGDADMLATLQALAAGQ